MINARSGPEGRATRAKRRASPSADKISSQADGHSVRTVRFENSSGDRFSVVITPYISSFLIKVFPMNYRPQSRSRILAFTLVELLTVITIIAILMGLLFPAINIAKDQARKAEARTAVTGIVASVKQYYTEYGKYPLGDQATPSSPTDVIFGDNGVPNQKLFDILRNVGPGPGQPNQYNPRAIVFFEGRTATDKSAPKSGFAQAAGPNGVNAGDYVDPWGYPYRICIDGDYDNRISNLPYADFKDPSLYPLTGVAAFSVGKDGAVGSAKAGDQMYKSSNGTTSDDIISWQ
jgi:type II secretory pathway pseudopilin PulG